MSRMFNMLEINGKIVYQLEEHKQNPNYQTEKRQVFIIGSKGIPATYGGFETFVEKLTEYQVSEKIHYHVSRIGKDNIRYEYNGAKCFNVEVPDIGPAKAIYYDVAALIACINYCKARPSIKEPVFYVLACRIGPFIGLLKREIKNLGGVLYINPDGHEWKRGKWSRPVRMYWKLSERWMVKHADLLICDSVHIEAYIKEDYKQYNPRTTYISYGSEMKASSLTDDDVVYTNWLKKNRIKNNEYYLIVARFVPENNFETMIREFMKSSTKKDLVIITTNNDKFLEKLEEKLHFKNDSRIKFVGTVYEQELLKKIRENAYAYLHGHEVGGTNPSLLEALSHTKLNLLLDVNFNKAVGEEAAVYWNKEEDNLARLIEFTDSMKKNDVEKYGVMAKKRIEEEYCWEYIVNKYEKIFQEMN